MTGELPAAIDGAIEAVNRGDTDAFVVSFADNGQIDDWGRVFTGHDEIRGWSDRELIGVQATLDVTAVELTDSGVAVSAQVGGNGFNGPSTFTFDLEGDRISRMTITA